MNKFCVAAFNAIRKENNNTFTPCCMFKSKEIIDSVYEYMNSDYMADVRKRMINNDAVPECNNCWNKEQHGLPSLRKIYNRQFFKIDIVPEKLVQKAKIDQIVHADIKIGNICNFSCAMCHPGNSSLIYNKFLKNLDNEFVKEYTFGNNTFMDSKKNKLFRDLSLQTLKDVLSNPGIKSIKLLGGEPLIEEKFLEELINVPSTKKQKLVLYIVTNGSIDLVDTLNKLGEYKKIYITVSLEGINDVQDYVRKNSNWKKIESNIHKFLKYSNPNWLISIHHTVQALSLDGLPDLIKWCNTYNLEINFQMLTEPDYLSLNILDQNYRLSCINKMPIPKYANEFLDFSQIDIAGYCMNVDFKPELKSKFLRYIEFYESDHDLKLKKIAPKLWTYLNN